MGDQLASPAASGPGRLGLGLERPLAHRLALDFALADHPQGQDRPRDDRRAKLICLTDRGLEAQRVGYALFNELEGRWAEQFGAERIALLREALEEIAAAKAPGSVPELARAELDRAERSGTPAPASA